ncbi:hypothetical protein A4G99_20740 [Haladaptatus sp. R4]|nr:MULTISPECIES: hypothetical protein [unclassified Haladaptatus]KZN26477.1 hypothetical protein A4G99_20740 [Haladaptatus sp. R4]
MSIWLVSYKFRDGSVVRRTLDAQSINEAYDVSALPETLGDRVLDSIDIEERESSNVLGTSIRFGSEEECTQPTPQKTVAEPAGQTRTIAQRDTS